MMVPVSKRKPHKFPNQGKENNKWNVIHTIMSLFQWDVNKNLLSPTVFNDGFKNRSTNDVFEAIP